MNEIPHARIFEKIKSVPPDRLAEIEDYVDFVLSRTRDERQRQDFLRGTEESLRRVWDNDDDAIYDKI